MAEPADFQRPRWLFMSPRDIGLFLRSARTDAAIVRLRATGGDSRAAFEAAYAGGADPWASADPRYYYQRWKYDGLLSALPAGRRFGRALDLGSGVGAFTLKLTSVADDVLGLDIAQAAVDRAGGLARPGLRFAQADINALDPALDGRFDLIVVADTLYYLDAVDDFSLKTAVARIARLAAPGGLCLVANHYFYSGDSDSRLSRRIQDAFTWSPSFAVLSARRRPFYLTTLLRALPLADQASLRPASLPEA